MKLLQPQQLSFLLWSNVDSKILADETDDSNWCILFQATPKLSEDKVRQCADTHLHFVFWVNAVMFSAN